MITDTKYIRLEQTCIAAPEQYNIYNDKTIIGYIRYRYGTLTVNPVINEIYYFNIDIVNKKLGNNYEPCLPDDIRKPILDNCVDQLIDFYNSNEGERFIKEQEETL